MECLLFEHQKVLVSILKPLGAKATKLSDRLEKREKIRIMTKNGGKFLITRAISNGKWSNL